MNESEALKHLNAIRCLGIKATFLCNNRCGFCWQPHHASASDISVKALENLRPLIERGQLKIIQPAGGEIFLWKGIKDFIELVERHNKGVRMYLVTNGTLFNDYWFSKAEAGFFSVVNFSINAPNKELYREISGRDHFGKAQKALTRLGQLKSKIATKIQVSFVMTRPLIGKLHEFIELVAGKADVLLVREYRPPVLGSNEQKEFYSKNNIPEKLKEQVCNEMESVSKLLQPHGCIFDYSQYSLDLNSTPIFSEIQTPSYDYSDSQCNHLFNQIQVEHTGDVRLGCNFSGISIGNLNEKSISDILANPLISEMRDNIINKKNYTTCPSKVSLRSCPYALKQISCLSGVKKYILELPEFSFKRNTLLMNQTRSQKWVQTAMNEVDEILSYNHASVLELGTGFFTPILMTKSKFYTSDYLSNDDKYLLKIRRYFSSKEYNFDNIKIYSEREEKDIEFAVINTNSVVDDISELEEKIIQNGYILLNTGHRHNPEMQNHIRKLTESENWILYKNYGYLAFLFQKSRSKKEGHDQILEDYNKMIAATDSFLKIPKNIRKIALYCGNDPTHTYWLMSFYYLFLLECPKIEAVLLDTPENEKLLFNKKAQKLETFAPSTVDAIVLSTDKHQEELKRRCLHLYGNNIEIIDLYKKYRIEAL